MSRQLHWEEHLAQLVESWRLQPFVWGQYDCAQFALAVLRAVSSRDWAQLGVQPYKSARGAQAMLRLLGVRDMPALATKILGPSLPPAFARRGDLVSCASPQGAALGVCLGTQLAFPGPAGLVVLSAQQATQCWRI